MQMKKIVNRHFDAINSCDKPPPPTTTTINFLPNKSSSNFHNISALSANALAVMQFISNSENNSNKLNHPQRLVDVQLQSTVDVHGSQPVHSVCYVSDLDEVSDERSTDAFFIKCMDPVQMNHRRTVVAAVCSSKNANYLLGKRLRNNNFLRRIINKTANNQCDAHAKSKDFSIDFLLN